MAVVANSVLVLAAFLVIAVAAAQEPENLRPETTVSAGSFGEINSAIYTNKTKSYLSCESGDMVVTIDFAEPFYGIIYANRDPTSPCIKHGDGKKVYTISLPLQGCGTREEEKRMFVNDLVVRFREGLIIDEDETKTIICRYGPPVAPIVPPFVPIPPLPVEPPSIVAKPKRLSEAEIYVIVCFLLFLALLLLGVGLAYYCLKRRNIKVVRKRRAAPSGPPSEITKLSSTLSAFDGFRIPRAAAHSMSGSEAALLTGGDHSDTIPSDYPSESPSSAPSDVEEVVNSNITTVDEHYRYQHSRDNIFTISGAASDLQERSLTTIYEHEDLRRSQQEEEERIRRSISGVAAAPPVYARIRKRQAELAMLEEHRTHVIPRVHAASIMDTRPLSEALEEFAPMQRPPMTTATETENARTARSLSEFVEPPAIYTSPDAPLIPIATATARRHTIDDRYVTTLTETHTEEDVTRLTRETTDMHRREPPQWDVLIRAYPPPPSSRRSSSGSTSTEVQSEMDAWDQLSYVSERTGEPIWRLITTDDTLRTKLMEARTVEEVETLRQDSRYERMIEPRHWDVIIRILSGPPEVERAPSESSSSVTGSEISVPRSAASLTSYNRGRRKSDWDARSRRSSLPPLAEDDRLSLTPSQAEVLYDDDGYDDWGGAEGYPVGAPSSGVAPRSIAERSTTEIVEHMGDYYHRQMAGSSIHEGSSTAGRGYYHQRPSLLRSVSGTEADEEDWRPESPSASSSATSRRHRLLERSSTEIILDSPIVAMMAADDRSSSAASHHHHHHHHQQVHHHHQTSSSDWLR